MNTTSANPNSFLSGNPTFQEWVQIDEKRKKYTRIWGSDWNAPSICILHGLGEHGGRYHRLAVDFVSKGFQVFSFDQQGHGLSPEGRGCIASYDSLMDDVEAFLSWVATRKVQEKVAAREVENSIDDSTEDDHDHESHDINRQHELSRTVLFGHSMGGNLVLNYALRKSVLPSIVVSSSPMIEAVRAPGPVTEWVLRSLMRVRPDWQLSKPLRPERIMSDPVEQELMKSDELFHTSISLRLGASLLDSGRWLLQNAGSLPVPTLLTHGTDDALTKPSSSNEFAQKAGEVCRFESLPGHLHDPFRDVEREPVIDLITSWIDEQLASERRAPTATDTQNQMTSTSREKNATARSHARLNSDGES